jgi:hypothetical protein
MKERSHVDDLSIYGKIILKLILEEMVGRAWTGLVWVWGRLLQTW